MSKFRLPSFFCHVLVIFWLSLPQLLKLIKTILNVFTNSVLQCYPDHIKLTWQLIYFKKHYIRPKVFFSKLYLQFNLNIYRMKMGHSLKVALFMQTHFAVLFKCFFVLLLVLLLKVDIFVYDWVMKLINLLVFMFCEFFVTGIL